MEVLHLPPAARALLLGLMITISGVWVLSDYAGGPTGEDPAATQTAAESGSQETTHQAISEDQDGELEPFVPSGEEAAPLNESQEERPATVDEAEVDCEGEQAEDAFSFTYWVIDHVVFVLADPVPSGSEEQAIYEWDWGDGTLSYGGAFMSHHYLDPDARYPVELARLAADGTVTHESRRCIDPGLYFVEQELVEGDLITLSGDLNGSASAENLTLEAVDPEREREQGTPSRLATEPKVEGDLVHWAAWLPGALVAMVIVTLVVALRVTRR